MKKIKMPNLTAKERQNSLNEIRFLASIESPHVVEYRDAIFSEATQELYLIMEYLGGGDLFSRLKYLKKKNRYMEEHIVWSYAI
jgi:NIMA (never in mitosis gene a)-related kinase